MRIAVVTPLFPVPDDPYRGRPIYESVRALKPLADVHVLCATASYLHEQGRAPAEVGPGLDPAVGDITFLSYPAVPVLSRPRNGTACAKHLHPHVAALRPDIVLNYWLYPEGYAGLEVARSLGIPAVLSARGSDLRRIQDPITQHFVTKAVRKSDRLLTVSEELRERAIDLGADHSRVVTIRNGCDRSTFRPLDRARVRAELGIAPREKVLLYVGRLTKAKGVLDLLEVFQTLRGEIPDLRLVLLGHGPLEKKARSFGAEGRILLSGSQPPGEVARWMSAADLFCLPSYSEGCPNVVIEAIASGCPTVATNVGGIPELAVETCAILLPPGDKIRLAAGIREGLSRTWDRASIPASYTRTWEDVAAETLTLCEDAIRDHAPKRPARARQKRLKITVVTPYFPTAPDSYRGHSAVHTLRHLQHMADIDVIVPLVSYRGLSPRRKDLDSHPSADFRPEGIATRYFAYPAIPLLSRPWNGRICARRLLPLVRQSSPDLILNYWLYPEGYSAVSAGHTLGIPVIVGSIGSDLRRIDPVTRLLVKHTLHHAAGVITVSEELRQRALALGVAPEDVQTILNGYDASVFFPGDRREARRSLAWEDGGRLLLFVGSLLKTKGLRELIAAFRSVAQRLGDVRLVMIGNGELEDELRASIAAAGLQDRAVLLGRRGSSEVAAWMRAADLFCLPSYSEGCPNVVVEALACGLPVVATDVGGIPELVGPEQGYLIPARDAERLAAALEKGLARPWDTAAIAAANRRGWEEVAAETYAFCMRIAETHHGR